jgi:hypothetical protein
MVKTQQLVALDQSQNGWGVSFSTHTAATRHLIASGPLLIARLRPKEREFLPRHLQKFFEKQKRTKRQEP